MGWLLHPRGILPIDQVYDEVWKRSVRSAEALSLRGRMTKQSRPSPAPCRQSLRQCLRPSLGRRFGAPLPRSRTTSSFGSCRGGQTHPVLCRQLHRIPCRHLFVALNSFVAHQFLCRQLRRQLCRIGILVRRHNRSRWSRTILRSLSSTLSRALSNSTVPAERICVNLRSRNKRGNQVENAFHRCSVWGFV